MFLLYGLMDVSSPQYVASRGDELISVTNVLASLRADHMGRLELLALSPLGAISSSRLIGCRQHEFTADQLNSVQIDVEQRRFQHQGKFRQTWESLLSQICIAGQQNRALKDLQRYGLRPIRPALFDARLFDGGLDSPEDIHHLCPLGIGGKLLNWLPDALRIAFPLQRVRGHASQYFYPNTMVGGPYLTLEKGDDVTWDLHEDVHILVGHLWVSKGANSGFVPSGCIQTDQPADYDFRYALDRLDAALSRMGQHYVASFKRFDFPSLADLVGKNGQMEGEVFNRATTTEIALLYLTYVLPSILPQSGEFDWISSTFLAYNKFYWTWRRETFFESDFEILDRHRLRLKQLMVDNWAVFSKSRLCTPKFHGLDHPQLDIRRHCGPAYTGSGPGDHAHLEKSKRPFKFTSKTKVSAVLDRGFKSV